MEYHASTMMEPDPRPRVRDAETAAAMVRDAVTDPDREHFIALSLDARAHVIEVHVVSIGTVDAALVHPREVFRHAIRDGATSLIVAHNHPSGSVEPSTQDRLVLDRLHKAGDIIGIAIMDALVVSHLGHYSHRERGEL